MGHLEDVDALAEAYPDWEWDPKTREGIHEGRKGDLILQVWRFVREGETPALGRVACAALVFRGTVFLARGPGPSPVSSAQHALGLVVPKSITPL